MPDTNYIEQIDIDLLFQKNKPYSIRAELVNRENFKTVEQVEGAIQQDDYSIDSDSDIRNRYKVIFVVTDSTFSIGRDTKIWLDKYIRLSIGIYSNRLQDIRWYPIGLFIFSSLDYSYNPSTKTLTMSCLDRTAELIGERNGQLSGITTLIPTLVNDENGDSVNNTIRSAIISTITQLGGVTKYRVEDIGKPVPYDLEFGRGSFVWDIVKKLKDLYPGWEAFFEDEYFIFQPIPTCSNDPIVLDSNMMSKLVISENRNINLGDIKNVVEVWGKCLDANYYTENVFMDSITGLYTLTYGAVFSLSNNLTFGFKATANNRANATIKIDTYPAYPIVGEGNLPIAPNRIQSGKSYVVKHVVSGSQHFYYFMGEYQICAVAKLVSQYPDSVKIQYDLLNEPTNNISYIVQPDSPFCSDFEDVGEIRLVLSDGEFENIYSEDLARQRAEYENWRLTDLLDSISLTMIDVPWLKVNQKIEYALQENGETNVYIVKSKNSSSISGIMTINCIKFQPLYPWLSD